MKKVLFLLLTVGLVAGLVFAVWPKEVKLPEPELIKELPGGVLTMFGGSPPTLDPAVAADATSAEYIVEIFSGLVTWVWEKDEKTGVRTLKLIPDIAKEWKISEDGKVYTFILRDDVRFQLEEKKTLLVGKNHKFSAKGGREAKLNILDAKAQIKILAEILGPTKTKEGKPIKSADVKHLKVTVTAPDERPKIYTIKEDREPLELKFKAEKRDPKTGKVEAWEIILSIQKQENDVILETRGEKGLVDLVVFPRAVLAEDFKFSFERAADPKTMSPVADTYLGDIVGVKEKLAGKATEVRGVKVLDDYTLEITIKEPIVYFLAKLTYPTAFVVDKNDVARGMGWFYHGINGTGPFRLKEYKVEEYLNLARNNYYYKGPAYLDEVHHLLVGGRDYMIRYIEDAIQVTHIGLADIEKIRDPKNPLHKELQEVTYLSLGYLGFNVKMPPFDDPLVRQAFAMAINKRGIIEAVLKGFIEPARGILPPGIPGHNPSVQGWEYNPEQARAFLAKSKYAKEMPPLTLYVPGRGADPGPYISSIVADIETTFGWQPGTISIRLVHWGTFLKELEKKTYPMFMLGWIADYPDPQNFLDILFHSKSYDNKYNYANPEVDRLLEQARTERNEALRLKLYQEAETLILRDAPIIPMSYGKGFLLVKPYVRGWIEPPTIIPRLHYVWFTQTATVKSGEAVLFDARGKGKVKVFVGKTVIEIESKLTEMRQVGLVVSALDEIHTIDEEGKILKLDLDKEIKAYIKMQGEKVYFTIVGAGAKIIIG